MFWRHPLNVVASWLDIGWRGADFVGSRHAVRERFEGTELWPPPADPIEGLAWSAGAATVVLLESAARTGALVRAHEDNALDPGTAVAAMLEYLGLETVPVESS